MDSQVGLIADYAHNLRFADLPAPVVHQCKRCVVDTFGVALGAYDAEPSRVARKMAQRSSVTQGARIIGTAHRTLPELAAFANGVTQLVATTGIWIFITRRLSISLPIHSLVKILAAAGMMAATVQRVGSI